MTTTVKKILLFGVLPLTLLTSVAIYLHKTKLPKVEILGFNESDDSVNLQINNGNQISLKTGMCQMAGNYSVCFKLGNDYVTIEKNGIIYNIVYFNS